MGYWEKNLKLELKSFEFFFLKVSCQPFLYQPWVAWKSHQESQWVSPGWLGAGAAFLPCSLKLHQKFWMNFFFSSISSLNFWLKYNHIISPSNPTSPPWPCVTRPHAHFQIQDLFPKILLVSCICSTYINAIHWVHLILLVCIIFRGQHAIG